MEPGLRTGWLRAGYYPWPVFVVHAESFSHRIEPDIGIGFLEFVMIADSVVEEIVLSLQAHALCLKSFPCCDDCMHGLVIGENQQSMEMVGHQKKEPAMPAIELVVELRRCQQLWRNAWLS